MPYEKTTVGVEESKMDIDKLFQSYGVLYKQYLDSQGGVIGVTFKSKIDKVEHLVKFTVPVPSPKPAGKRNSKKVAARQQNTEEIAWRGLFWTLKSFFEIMQFDIRVASKVLKN